MQDAFPKKVVASGSKKQAVVRMKHSFNLSERQACQLVGTSQPGLGMSPKRTMMSACATVCESLLVMAICSHTGYPASRG